MGRYRGKEDVDNTAKENAALTHDSHHDEPTPVIKSRGKRNKNKVKRLGIASSGSDTKVNNVPAKPPTLKHMEPSNIPNGS